MKWKRALGISIVTYISAFIVGLINAGILGIDLATTEVAPTSLWVLGIITGILLMVLFSLWYFNKVKATWKEGLYFGLFVIGVGFIVDALIIIPAIIFTDAAQNVTSYYLSPWLWLTIVTMVGAATAVGHLKK